MHLVTIFRISQTCSSAFHRSGEITDNPGCGESVRVRWPGEGDRYRTSQDWDAAEVFLQEAVIPTMEALDVIRHPYKAPAYLCFYPVGNFYTSLSIVLLMCLLTTTLLNFFITLCKATHYTPPCQCLLSPSTCLSK